MREIVLAVAIVLWFCTSFASAQCPGGVCPTPAGPRRPGVVVATPRAHVSVNRNVQVHSVRRPIFFGRFRR